MIFTQTSSKKDPVITYTSNDGFYKITKRANTGYILKKVSLFNILGDVIGEYSTLEEAIKEVR